MKFLVGFTCGACFYWMLNFVCDTEHMNAWEHGCGYYYQKDIVHNSPLKFYWYGTGPLHATPTPNEKL